MTKNVLRGHPAMVFWLVAGTGISAIIAFTGAVLMVRPVTQVAQTPIVLGSTQTIVSQPNAQQAIRGLRGLNNGPTPHQQAAQSLKHVSVQPTHTEPASQRLLTGLAETPSTRNQRTGMPPASGDVGRPSFAAIAAPSSAPPAALLQHAATPSTMRPEFVAQASKLGAAAARPVLAEPAGAQPPIQQPARPVETVVVTAQSYQQMAFSVDTIGRGNSLVIQLPRSKRNP